jgi:hypothetical protein
MMARLRRIPLLAFAPILATLTLMAWVFASPIGAGPDDDFHLVSAWCLGPAAAAALPLQANMAQITPTHRVHRRNDVLL